MEGSKEVKAIEALLIKRFAEVMGVSADSIDPGVPITAYAFDSMKVVEMVSLLNAELGVDIDPSVIFEETNLESLAKKLSDGKGLSIRTENQPL